MKAWLSSLCDPATICEDVLHYKDFSDLANGGGDPVNNNHLSEQDIKCLQSAATASTFTSVNLDLALSEFLLTSNLEFTADAASSFKGSPFPAAAASASSGGGAASAPAAAHSCHLCRRRFAAVDAFCDHLRHHGRQTNLPCDYCAPPPPPTASAKQRAAPPPPTFASTTLLWRHIAKKHLPPSTSSAAAFACSVCRKSFAAALNFHLHMLIHLGEQPEPCRFCGRAFRTKPSRRKHELTHTGIKAFACAVSGCKATFKSRDELKQHGTAHTSEKRFLCSHCHDRFKYAASMKRHEKKGRCLVGKHWCPLKKKNYKAKSASTAGTPPLIVVDPSSSPSPPVRRPRAARQPAGDDALASHAGDDALILHAAADDDDALIPWKEPSDEELLPILADVFIGAAAASAAAAAADAAADAHKQNQATKETIFSFYD